MKIPRLTALALIPLLVNSCAWLAPDYQRPEMALPGAWFGVSGQPGGMTGAAWWKNYQDPALDRLVDESLAHNGDLALAGARLRQARATYDFAFANQFPLLSLGGNASRSRLSPFYTEQKTNLGALGGLLTYELDIWGRQASAREATRSAMTATQFRQDALRLSVSAATAQLYFSLMALDADIRITEETIRSREESYAIVRKQFEREAANGLVLRQSEAEMEGTRARLAQLLIERDKAETSLSVLLGRPPREIIEGQIERGAEIAALPASPVMPDDLPSTLLERRPDIASAEAALIASNFKIGIARAAYFPQITLSSLLGISSVDVQSVFNSTMRTWQLGASMAGPVLDFGRTSSGVDLAKEEFQELLEGYKNTIRTAFKEVRDALSEQVHTQSEEEARVREEQALQEALRLANLRYAAGYSSYIEVLDAQRSLYSAQIALVAVKRARLNASVNMHKALGGGWTEAEALRPASEKLASR